MPLPVSIYFEIKPSTIVKGEEGLFAKKDIAKGQVLYRAFYKNPDVNSKVFEQRFMESNINSKINHSDNPNCYNFWYPLRNTFYAVAKRNIKAGEELTKNYGETMKMAKSIGFPFHNNLLWFKK